MNKIGRGVQEIVRKILQSPIVRDPLRREFFAYMMREPKIIGPRDRLHLSAHAGKNNFLANTNSGHIYLGDFVLFGKNVALITGTHNYEKFGLERIQDFPKEGNDIFIGDGAWIATNAVIIGPCKIGEHAVVAAGSVVVGNVAPYTVVGGVPARQIKKISPAAGENEVPEN